MTGTEERLEVTTTPVRSILIAIALCLMLAAVGLAPAACGSAGEEEATGGQSTEGTSGTTDTATAGETTTTGPREDAGGETLSVWAAAGLKNAFTQLGEMFDGATGAQTTMVFDAAGALSKQIAAGAPADVFASADPKFMTALTDEGFVDEATVMPFASSEVVLIVPAESTLGLTGFEDLANAEVKKIAVGNPETTPLGEMTLEEILPRLGILEQVQPKLVYSQTVSQTLTWTSAGEVDAGIVWASEALAGGDGVKTVATADPAWHSEVTFVIGVVSDSGNKELAQSFVDFILGPEGRSILRSHGFLTISPED